MIYSTLNTLCRSDCSITFVYSPFGLFSDLAFNDAGQVAFFSTITGGSTTGGIFLGTSEGVNRAIALQGLQTGSTTGGATISILYDPVLNAAGQIAYRVNLTGGTSTSAIYRTNIYNSPYLIAWQGNVAPESGVATFSSFTDPVLNGSGQTAFIANMTGGSSTSGVYRSSSGTTLTAIAVQGQLSPVTGGGAFSSFRNVALNDAGQTSFIASATGGSVASGLYRSSSGSELTAIAVRGQLAPGSGSATFSSFYNVALNDAGQTAFLANMTGGSSTSGLYRSSSGSQLTAIAVQGQKAAGTGLGTFSSFNDLVMNEGGQVAFLAGINGGTGSSGLYVGDGRDTVLVQLQGASLAGSTASSFVLSNTSLNNFGQVAYTARLSNSLSGIFLFTPELRWRETYSDSWDTASSWTLGIRPDAVHDVRIDPTTSLTVTGPSSHASVRSLSVGGGTGFATLDLNGGTLAAENGVQIERRGILSGEGTIDAQVINAGTVLADNLLINGGLINNGSVRSVGNESIYANLTNNTGGVVRVDLNQALMLDGTTHSNSGNFELRGGEMVVSGATTNNASGRVLFNGNGSIVRFNDGLTNNGQMQMSFGSAEVFGNVTTNTGGKIILSGNSNTTFYDEVDVKSGGELRVSSGSNAVFFGQVLQRTGSLFTGTGSKFYEGGLSVGNSPGLGVDTGNVSFGAMNEYLAEIAGTALGDGAGNGLEFDRYIVNGTLSLGGSLKLVSYNDFIAQAGQSFDLFDWGALTGTFASIDYTGFNLANGTQLDLSRLYVDGAISVTAVPEPGSYALMLAGLGLIGFASRKRKTN